MGTVDDLIRKVRTDPPPRKEPAQEFGSADVEDDDDIVRPINWNLLDAKAAQSEWLDLDAWVTWMRITYGLPPTVIPPYWHRHDELVWELSALHVYWLNAYDPDGPPTGPVMWHREFAEARQRLREWVSTAGTKLERDRPTRQTTWPGEAPVALASEVVIEDRAADFRAYVIADVSARLRIQEQFEATQDVS